MENIAEALKMAGYMLIFIIGLSVAIMTITYSKEATESIIEYSDNTRFRSNITLDDADNESNRMVSVNDIIPTLYRYRQEDYIILFYDIYGNALPIINDNTIKQTNNSKLTYLNYHIDEYFNEEWMINENKTKEHIDNITAYLLENYKNDSIVFEEQITETSDIFKNNMSILDKDGINPLIRNKDNEKKRVIKYIQRIK